MSTQPWTIGQRVRSEAEPSLGLGVITGFPTSRSLEITFPGAGERRLYNPATAPLHRYELGVGQTGQTRDGQAFRVERIERSADGLLTYFGQGLTVPEIQLADVSASRDPIQRLFAGDFSPPEAFKLREAAWKLRSDILQRRSRGLMGARVTLLPHQLAIAYKVSNREYPRALLADEVGLGKTIEACLVYSTLRALGRADRVLVLTPSSLVHQWLVELYRRFNDLFTVAHGEVPGLERAPRRLESAPDNPFAEAPRLIAPIDWLLSPGRLEQALEQPWDLIIVDEAHHLTWTRAHASPEYRAVEALAKRTQGLLMLTATPLRQGLETEFGLLRLVDPERFADYEQFEREQAHLRTVADLARRLDQGETITSELSRQFPDGRWDGSPGQSLQQLIDRHGTGRVLIRNRREKLGGFPGRQLHLQILPLPAGWKKVEVWPEITGLQRMLGETEAKGLEPPSHDDPRWDWVFEVVRSLGDQKVVVMASTVAAVKWLEKQFRRHSGIKVAVFHEQLGLVERDRQAAYFADPDGARVLLSSEIGGEGRNFQFCHHLILFDVPVHPDALEQRIGRLDRIGQTGTIHVHAAVVEQTPAEALFEWHRTLQVFDSPLTGGDPMLAAQARDLLDVLEGHTPGHADRARLAAFLDETAERFARQKAEVDAGVDYLIDLNSFDQALGCELVDDIRSFDDSLLKEGLSGLLEYFGVVEEDLSDPLIERIRPGDTMKVEAVPGLRADGYLATYDRSLALAREDLQFLSPDHPLVEGMLSLLLDQSEGRASIAHWTGAPEPGAWVEFLFLLEAVGPSKLGLTRFLPPVSVAVTLDLKGQRHPSAEESGASLRSLNPQIWTQMAGVLQDKLTDLLEAGEAMANTQLRSRVDQAKAQASAVLEGEHRRLEELRRLGNVSEAEVTSHALTLAETLRRLGEATVSLDAVRIILLDPRG